MSVFEILWYNGGSDHAPNRVIGRTFVKRHDLSAAITSACNLLRKGSGDASGAHGFYAQRLREGSHGEFIYNARKGR